MLPRNLLFIMSLVLRCGIRIVYDRSSDAAVVHIIMNPRIGGIFGIEGPYHSATMVNQETRMARVYHVRYPDLAVICLPGPLLGNPLFLAAAVGRGIVAAGILLGLGGIALVVRLRGIGRLVILLLGVIGLLVLVVGLFLLLGRTLSG